MTVKAKKEVKLLDLQAQYSEIQDEVEKAVLEVLRSGYYVLGPNVQAFEKEAAEHLGAKHAIGCANGSDALYIALLALDIKAGDEVITTPFTYIATAEAITQIGAKPVFADIKLDTFNIDPQEIEKKITPKTKAIILVHLFGQACEMDEIMAIAKKHNIKVVEDTAQAFGTQYTFSDIKKAEQLVPNSRLAKSEDTELTDASMSNPQTSHNAEFEQGCQFSAGAIADIGTYSFYPTKNLSCAGDGGLMTTNSDELNERIRKIRAHGSSKRYYHDELGVNSRLDEVQAAILRIKLKQITAWNEAREKNAAIYDEKLSGMETKDYKIITPAKIKDSSHIYHQYSIRIEDKKNSDSSELRDSVRAKLQEAGIGSEVYYPLALHMQNIYADLGHKPEDFPNALKAAQSVLSIPVHPNLNSEDINYVIENIFAQA